MNDEMKNRYATLGRALGTALTGSASDVDVKAIEAELEATLIRLRGIQNDPLLAGQSMRDAVDRMEMALYWLREAMAEAWPEETGG